MKTSIASFKWSEYKMPLKRLLNGGMNVGS